MLQYDGLRTVFQAAGHDAIHVGTGVRGVVFETVKFGFLNRRWAQMGREDELAGFLLA
jgi:hypothetical protein